MSLRDRLPLVATARLYLRSLLAVVRVLFGVAAGAAGPAVALVAGDAAGWAAVVITSIVLYVASAKLFERYRGVLGRRLWTAGIYAYPFAVLLGVIIGSQLALPPPKP